MKYGHVQVSSHSQQTRNRGKFPQLDKKKIHKALQLTLLLKSGGKKQGCPLSLLLFNFILKALANAVRKEKEIKDTQFGKEKNRLPLFVDDVTVYVKEQTTTATTKNSWN